MSRQHPETATEAVTYAIGEFEWRQDHSQYTSAEEFIGFLRESGYDVTPTSEGLQDALALIRQAVAREGDYLAAAEEAQSILAHLAGETDG